ncbi:hypothetical protein [Arachidicoccus sp.]|jgi:hypothetical protein|uniref:hypothetical protein n=1 Tax=Arachidicoccus sp. TaxID=1872624 RepID=UPI003D19F4CD
MEFNLWPPYFWAVFFIKEAYNPSTLNRWMVVSDKQGLKILSGVGINSKTKQKRSKVLPLGKSTTSEAPPVGTAVGGSLG